MQEQSELQLLPFVVLTKEVNHDRYVLWNAGNGTAINVTVRITTGSPFGKDEGTCSTVTSILAKDQKDFVESNAYGAFENKYVYIEFENINKKRYFTSGKNEKGKTEIIEFGPVGALHALKRYPQPA